MSAVINFPVVEDPSLAYEAFGGYISRPLLRWLAQMLGTNPLAIKILTIVIWVAVLIWIMYTLNISMPSVNITLQRESRPARSTKTKTPKEKKQTDKPQRQSLLSWLVQKASRKTNDHDIPAQEKPLFNGKEKKLWSSNTSWSLIKSVVKSAISKKVDDKVHEKTIQHIDFPQDKPTFSTDIMDSSPDQWSDINKDFLIEKAQSLQSKLMEFNVPVEIQGFDIGPSVVQVRVKPEAWIKVSAIESLKNDIALSMKAKWLRIVAPIPGTDNIGIQIPNPQPRMVHLGDILKTSDFAWAMQKNLTNMALWQAIDGSNIILPLEKMPHLLVAGATGQGKSVWVNDMILSLIYQNSPSELKFLMIDPKQVEMELYSGLPYLLAPIVTQPDKALKILQRAVEEMELRYTKLKKTRVKKLEEYNKKHPEDKLYRIVIVIDELADLMMSGNKKDVETCITRIAQKARAVGMHLIIATQRPSVNVLTGLIKANIPTRLSFWVVSQVDSRTILGMKGAEDLVGRGDMLYLDATTKFPIRIQAPFVDTPEIERIMSSLKEKYMTWLTEDDIYHPEIVRILEWKVQPAFAWATSWAWDDEELIAQAIDIISQKKKASATMLQRTLNVWFARAARILDTLEERGVVWPQDGAKPREVYV